MISRLIPLALIFAAIGIFFGYVNPTYSGSVQALRTEIQGYDAALRAAEAFEEKQAALVNERNEIPAEDLARLTAFLPDGVDNIQLILDLNALADRSNITLADFDVEVPDPAEEETGALQSEQPYESLELSLTALGTYDAFKNFLHSIEWSLRPMDLVSLSVSDSTTGVYTYAMTFRIYWLR